jgi:hypothetical protein
MFSQSAPDLFSTYLQGISEMEMNKLLRLEVGD